MNPDHPQLDDGLLQELQSLEEHIHAETRQQEIRKKRAEGGKLGGRPKKEGSLKKQINVKYSETDYLRITKAAEALKIKPAELIRRASLGQPVPDNERNEILKSYRGNFNRIANIFRSQIWGEAEKAELRKELRMVTRLIIEELKK